METLTEFDLDRLVRRVEADAIDELRRRQRRRWFWRGPRGRLLQIAMVLFAGALIPLAMLLNEVLAR